jgi:hypothetical protein
LCCDVSLACQSIGFEMMDEIYILIVICPDRLPEAFQGPVQQEMQGMRVPYYDRPFVVADQ